MPKKGQKHVERRSKEDVLKSVREATAALERKHDAEILAAQHPTPPSAAMAAGPKSPRKVSHSAADSSGSVAARAQPTSPQRTPGVLTPGGGQRTQRTSGSLRGSPEKSPRRQSSPHKGSPRKGHSKYFLCLEQNDEDSTMEPQIPQHTPHDTGALGPVLRAALPRGEGDIGPLAPGDEKAIAGSVEKAWNATVETLSPPGASQSKGLPTPRSAHSVHGATKVFNPATTPLAEEAKAGSSGERLKRSSKSRRSSPGAILDALSHHLAGAEHESAQRDAHHAHQLATSPPFSFLPHLHPLHPTVPPQPLTPPHASFDYLRVASSASGGRDLALMPRQTPITAYQRVPSTPRAGAPFDPPQNAPPHGTPPDSAASAGLPQTAGMRAVRHGLPPSDAGLPPPVSASSHAHSVHPVHHVHPVPPARPAFLPLHIPTTGGRPGTDASTASLRRVQMMLWEDPLIPTRRKALEAGRVIRKAPTRELHRVMAKGLIKADMLDTGNFDSDLRHADELLEQPSLRTLDKSDQKMTSIKSFLETRKDGHKWQVPSLTPRVRKLPVFKQENGGIDWGTLTEIEKGSLPAGHHLEGQDPVARAGVPQLIENQGKLLERHCRTEILQETLRNVRWGDKDESIERGGLLQLHQSMRAADAKLPQYMRMIEKGKELIQIMSSEATQEKVLEAAATVSATGVEARQCVSYFVETSKAEDNLKWMNDKQKPGVETVEIEGLDGVLGDMWQAKKEEKMHQNKVKLERENIDHDLVVVDPEILKPQMTILDSTTIDKIQEVRQANRRHFERGMRPEDVHKHVMFHRDMRYIKYKTGNFKSVALQAYTTKEAEQEPSQNSFSNATMQKVENNYFLRVSVIEAKHLPKMDVSKALPCYNDTYVRLTMRVNGKTMVDESGAYAMFTTPVVWNAESPKFHQLFDFDVPPPSKVQSVGLTIEVFDVDIRGYSGGNEDNLIGMLEFDIIKDSVRSMPMEKEFLDWNQLLDRQGQRVRTNGGKPGGKIGGNSKLKLKVIYTKKMPKTMKEYCIVLQLAMRCRVARRIMDFERRRKDAREHRIEEIPSMQVDLDTRHIWDSYLQSCVVQKTHAIGKLKGQIATQGISLKNYFLSYPGVVALCDLLAPMGAVNRLRSLELINNNLRGSGIKAIADALEKSGQGFEAMYIEQNPVLWENKDVNSLNTAYNKLGTGMTGPKSIAQVLRVCTELRFLSLSSCSFGDQGMSIIALEIANHPRLTSLRLDKNNTDPPTDMFTSAKVLGSAVAHGQILEFSYSRNNLWGRDALALLGDGKLNSIGVLHSETLRKLTLKGNGLFRQMEPTKLIAEYIASDRCFLDYLNLDDNLLNAEGATLVGDALVRNKTLRELVVDNNMFGREGYIPIMQHRGRRKMMLQGQELGSADKGAGPPVAKTLEEIISLFRQFDENGDGTMDVDELSAFMKLLGNDWSEDRIRECFMEMLYSSQGDQVDFSSFYSWYGRQVTEGHEGEDAIKIKMVNCGVNIKSAQFDIQSPEGEYDLDMSLVKSKGMLVALMKLVYAGEGMFVVGTCYLETIDDEGELERKWMEIMVPPDISSWEVPSRGFLVFEFKLCKSVDLDNVDMSSLHDVREAFRRCADQHDRMAAVDKYFQNGNAQISSLQAVELLQSLVTLSTTSEARQGSLEAERVHLVSRIFRHVKDKENDSTLLYVLTPDERRRAEKKIGFATYSFTPGNPTGRHRLRLNKVRERQIAVRLIELREGQMPTVKREKMGVRTHSGGPRPDLERVMRNARLDGKKLDQSMDSWRVPLTGVLELDYVQITKPKPRECFAMDPTAFLMFIDTVRKESKDDWDRMLRIRAASEEFYFTCLQVLGLIELFNIFNEHNKYLRSEVAVCMFARIVDHRGYNVLITHIGVDGHRDLVRRIGRVNLFHDAVVSPVGYWSLHLEIPEDRWVMQELVHLASQEPGENMLHTKIDGCDFEVPGDWLSMVPKRQVNVTLFYGRSQAVSDDILSEGGAKITGMLSRLSSTEKMAKGAQFPPKFVMPTLPPENEWNSARDGTDHTWIRIEKVRNIVDRMRETCSTPSEMFELMDDDGGGSLSRDELSHALFHIGVWLPPDDMRTLLEIVDNDKSGEIDKEELTSFWDNAPPLRYGDEGQKSYWLKRGVKIDVYAKSMPFHDLRVLYDWNQIALYGMKQPHYTHQIAPKIGSLHNDPSFKERRRSSMMRLMSQMNMQESRRESMKGVFTGDITNELFHWHMNELDTEAPGAREMLFASMKMPNDGQEVGDDGSGTPTSVFSQTLQMPLDSTSALGTSRSGMGQSLKGDSSKKSPLDQSPSPGGDTP